MGCEGSKTACVSKPQVQRPAAATLLHERNKTAKLDQGLAAEPSPDLLSTSDSSTRSGKQSAAVGDGAHLHTLQHAGTGISCTSEETQALSGPSSVAGSAISEESSRTENSIDKADTLSLMEDEVLEERPCLAGVKVAFLGEEYEHRRGPRIVEVNEVDDVVEVCDVIDTCVRHSVEFCCFADLRHLRIDVPPDYDMKSQRLFDVHGSKARKRVAAKQ